MRVSHLSLLDFRNYGVAELSLEPGANLLVGKNGQGKTNLVEAIAYFSALRSHRISGDAALIRFGRETAVARLRVEAASRSVVLEVQLHHRRPNRALVNRAPAKPRDLPRWFASVMFVPEDLNIVRGDPSGRRKFLDDSLTLRHPIAGSAIGDYERVVRQRTALLKSARGARATHIDASLGVWDDQLVDFGTQIMLARRELIRDLEDPVRVAYETLVSEDHRPVMSLQESIFEIGHVSRETTTMAEAASVSRETLAEDFRAALHSVRSRELDRGVTLVGPHRDDLLLGLNNLPVKGYASHGESWSIALSLKLALAQVLREESPAGDPVIILDDVFAELDSGRRSRLMNAVSDFEQVIVTAAVESDVPQSVPWHRTEIRAGSIVGGEIDADG